MSQMLRIVAMGKKGFLPLVLLFGLLPACAMNLIHYDVDSLVYLSTDIVIAKLSINDQHKISATVEETIYGSLHPGDEVQELSPFLMFFQPMEDGMKVVLFLDRRPHSYDFFHQDAAKAPFAVPPSGVYMIDPVGHVHQYFQRSNPGPYVAQGYSDYCCSRKDPTPEEDLKLPTLEQTKREIKASIQSVDRMRPILDKKPSRSDVPQIFSVLDSRTRGGASCGRQADAISERLMQEVRSFDDPALLLKLQTVAVDYNSELSFVQHAGVRDSSFSQARVAYLLKVLADSKEELSLRLASAEILAGVNRMRAHAAGQDWPFKTWIIDNEWLRSSAAQIRDLARKIFTNEKGDPKLRGICLGFLPLDDPATLSEVKHVYMTTDSDQLHYSIERALLQVSDSLYESLNPPGGPVTSIIEIATRHDCVIGRPSGLVFVMRYGQERSFRETAMFAPKFYSLTNEETGARIAPIQVQYISDWTSVDNGESDFVLSKSSELAPGRYELRYEIAQPSGKLLSAGYPLGLIVKQTPRGNSITSGRFAMRSR